MAFHSEMLTCPLLACAHVVLSGYNTATKFKDAVTILSLVMAHFVPEIKTSTFVIIVITQFTLAIDNLCTESELPMSFCMMLQAPAAATGSSKLTL